VPNLNYRAGARLEYGRRKHWQKRGFEVVRSAGSHGIWDLCGVRVEDPSHPVMFIQCKRVETKSQANKIIKQFKEAPPMPASPHWQMILEVQIKGSSEILSITL
jgi:hypothetical protein